MVQGWQKLLKQRLRRQISDVFTETVVISTEVKVWGGCERVWLCLLRWLWQERWPRDEARVSMPVLFGAVEGVLTASAQTRALEALAWVGRWLCWLTHANHWADIFGFPPRQSPQAVSCCVDLLGLFIFHSAHSVPSPSSPCHLSLHRPLLTIFPDSHKSPCIRWSYFN